MCPIPLSRQTLENTAIYTVFFNFSMFQCRWPTQTYVQKMLQKHCFLQCFYNVPRQKHRNLHVFRHKVGPKHWFLQCFQCSGIQKLFKISLFTVFFHFCPFFHCRKPTKMTRNSISIPSSAQTPKNRRKISQTPPDSGLGAKPFLPPPPS